MLFRRALAERLHRGGHGGVPGNDDDLASGTHTLVVQERRAIAIGQAQVQQHDVWSVFRDAHARCFDVGGLSDFEILARDESGKAFAETGVIVDDQGGEASHGRPSGLGRVSSCGRGGRRHEAMETQGWTDVNQLFHGRWIRVSAGRVVHGGLRTPSGSG
jgi:hypothetical protein